ncbi:DUF2746 domain-containing protein [Arachnia propionica]|uniref:DUF2746 domain-containing protein n=1 Tax=Arachnia propionica TaxID=1750 RepID=A0A3P1T166_9ACTN|nr:DUF2746 domain-containing protein [Arachnia propionica]RRD03237.1 DUF2746 domain-containing protein [Arachnia propionica]
MSVLLETPVLTPESWGVIAGMALTVGAGVILGIRKGWAAILPILRSTSKATAEIKEQVANTHTTNLRVDMDVITAITSRIEEKADRLLEISERHDVEFKHVNSRLDGHDARFTAADQRITNVKAAVDHALHDHSMRLHEVEAERRTDWKDNP